MSNSDDNLSFSVQDCVTKLKDPIKGRKFEESIDVHFNLNINAKGASSVRGSCVLPKGNGKKVVIACIVDEVEKDNAVGADIIGNENMIADIKNTKKCNFDIMITTPSMMPKLGVIAPILGPRKLMPTPKNGTVSEDIKSAIKSARSGMSIFVTDKAGVISLRIGSLSFSDTDLMDNFNFIYDELSKLKPAGNKGKFITSIYLSSTMGSSYKVRV